MTNSKYLNLHAVLMTLKQMVQEEELVNVTGNNKNYNLHSKQMNRIPHSLQQYEKQWMQFN
jgi:hypothetical protein